MLRRHKISYKDTPELLTPTEIYAKEIQELLDEIPIVGMAHITGGGLQENIDRIIPEDMSAHIDWSSFKRPDIFNKIQNNGEIQEEEMRRVFNCGIGYVIIIPRDVEYGTQIGEIL